MNDKIFRDREILSAAEAKGGGAKIGAYLRLSGPGWLQSAITLGGGSLGGALYLGMLGGTSMLWLQLVAIAIGVIMLSAISYVTLTTGKRPYAAINEYVNPVLGVGWLTATILANMIFILPQFALCCDALDTNLFPGLIENMSGSTFVGSLSNTNMDPQALSKLIISLGVGLAAFTIVVMSFKPGWMSKIFDLLLKIMIAIVVISFVAVVYLLSTAGELDWAAIGMGFIPNIFHWNTPSAEIQGLLIGLDGSATTYWENAIIKNQQNSMIGVTSTAVGLNMTFLLPYSMLARGWDRPFRGLARWDLIMGMAIPYLLVTTCIVIASSHAFHAKADENFLSDDASVVQTSPLSNGAVGPLTARYIDINGDEGKTTLAEAEDSKQVIAEFVTTLEPAERQLALTLVKPNAGQLAVTLVPVFGDPSDPVSTQRAKLIFGLGALAMGFSTIIILMMINGFAFAEIFGDYHNVSARVVGSVAALVSGVAWVWLWGGASKTWLLVIASTFAGMLLPIAYVAFFLLMNSRKLLGDEKPTGGRMSIWNVLMLIGIAGAFAQAWGGYTKVAENNPEFQGYLLGGLGVFAILILIGFSARSEK
jgi:Mn2+/Fe2+ NRAMP family transporter